MSDCLITEQTIKVEQIYGVIGLKELPQEQWNYIEEEDWNGNEGNQ